MVLSHTVFPADGGEKLYIRVHSNTLSIAQIIKRLSVEPDVINASQNYIDRLSIM